LAFSLSGAEDAFAGPQNQADDVVLHAPSAGRAVETRGRGVKPVQVGDGEEAVRICALAFVRGAPLGPVRGEGLGAVG